MITVYKYELDFSSLMTMCKVEMPYNAEVLTVNVQNDKIYIWAKVNTDDKLVLRSYSLYGTGHEIKHHNTLEYIGTVFIDAFVFHIFEHVH